MSPPFRAAMVRFPTLERERWPRIVAALASLGFDSIDVPLVWREHERAPGVLDFHEGALSLEAMLESIRSAGLRAIVRFGPMSTDDATGLCIPERVLRDRACQARTRRQNPVFVPDPPRAAPLPSIASAAYREEATAWVRAAASAIAGLSAPLRETVARVILGDGPHALLRDDPFEIDHHPDARGERAAIDPPHDGDLSPALVEVRREAEQLIEFRFALRDAATSAGLDADRIVFAVTGAATISPAAHRLAREHALALAAPPPLAGTLAIWRLVRHALALGAHGAHFDVWCGGPAYYPPLRGSHTLAAARVVLAAGARDVTVRMGCAGERWIGAILSERGEERPHASQWRDLLAWSRTMPEGSEECVDLVEPLDVVEAARAATGFHPLPLGLLALVGVTPAAIAVGGAVTDGETMSSHEQALRGAEEVLTASGIPFRRTPHGAEATSMPRLLSQAKTRFARDAPRIEPEGRALVRRIAHHGKITLVALSRHHEAIEVSPPDGNWHGANGEPAGRVRLEPGEATVITRDAPAAKRPRAASSRPRGKRNP